MCVKNKREKSVCVCEMRGEGLNKDGEEVGGDRGKKEEKNISIVKKVMIQLMGR